MANGSVGRSSKGDRHTFATRIPRVAADLLMAEAERRGISYSEYIAVIVSNHHGIETDYPPPEGSRWRQSADEELPLGRVS